MSVTRRSFLKAMIGVAASSVVTAPVAATLTKLLSEVQPTNPAQKIVAKLDDGHTHHVLLVYENGNTTLYVDKVQVDELDGIDLKFDPSEGTFYIALKSEHHLAIGGRNHLQSNVALDGSGSMTLSFWLTLGPAYESVQVDGYAGRLVPTCQLDQTNLVAV